MNWKKIKPSHYFKEPVTHIYTQTIFDVKEYDRLYENQKNLDHRSWHEFDEKYKIGFEFKEKFENIDLDKEIICLWFFKERSDRTASYVNVAGKELTYLPNTFLITQSKLLSFVSTKRKYIRNPLIQIDMTLETYNNIVKKFQ